MNLKVKINRGMKARLLLSLQSGELDLSTYPEILAELNPKTEPFLELMKDACLDENEGSHSLTPSAELLIRNEQVVGSSPERG
jgi:hypothetical protein